MAAPVTRFATDELRELVADMDDTMRAMDGQDPTRSGRSYGSRALILVLADALGVSVDWLLSSDVEAGS